jgi:anhydro-N-acetylmuramic acid kinase
MSGTSLDGVDIALCDIDSSGCMLIGAIEYPFDSSLREAILEAIGCERCSLLKFGEIDIRLGELFAHGVNTLLSQYGIKREEIEVIGSHGQTIWHSPHTTPPFTIQLGDPSIIATKTGIKVVSNFRDKDIALGGEGAPLTPAFHQFLFGNMKRKIGVVNIGGISNITIIGNPLKGYDIGCGNILLDIWIGKCKNQKYDKDGSWALEGEVDRELLDSMLNEPFFTQTSPKSTGRELFNLKWIESHLQGRDIDAVDIQTTLLELTAEIIAYEVQNRDIELLLLCGGGSKNRALVNRIEKLLQNITVDITDNYGVSSDYMEAMAFAWLGYKRINREVVELKDVTGAIENGILGGVWE